MKTNVYFENNLEIISSLLINERVFVIIDEKVLELYSDNLKFQHIIPIKATEENKTLHTVEKIIFKLMDMEADREAFLLGIGGGIITDITGLTASLFMRGMKFGFVPTTLLAQVDAAIGGKNGVNFLGYKNLIGNFRNPDLLIINHSFLKTLPQEEITNGFAEIIKYGLIYDKDIFEKFEDYTITISSFKLPEIIKKCVNIKRKICKEDFEDNGIRKILNFGHTLGHAIEKETSFSHGRAISIGMIKAVNLSQAEGFLSEEELMRIMIVFSKYNLPIELMNKFHQVLDNLDMDKKKSDQSIDYILLENIGKATVKKYNIIELKTILNELH